MRAVFRLLLLALLLITGAARADNPDWMMNSSSWGARGDIGSGDFNYICQVNITPDSVSTLLSWDDATTANVACSYAGNPQYFTLNVTANCPSTMPFDQASFSCTSSPPASGGADADHYAQIWGIGFSAVLFCFLLGRGVGAVLEFIREG